MPTAPAANSNVAARRSDLRMRNLLFREKRMDEERVVASTQRPSGWRGWAKSESKRGSEAFLRRSGATGPRAPGRACSLIADDVACAEALGLGRLAGEQ